MARKWRIINHLLTVQLIQEKSGQPGLIAFRDDQPSFLKRTKFFVDIKTLTSPQDQRLHPNMKPNRKRKPRLRSLVAVILSVALAQGCGDNPTGPPQNPNPEFLQQPSVVSISLNGFGFALRTNVDGVVYFAVLENGVPAPAAQDVISGTDAVASSSFEATAGATHTLVVGSLASGVTYHLYAVLQDEQGNLSPVSPRLAVTTGSPLPRFLDQPLVVSRTTSGFTFSVRTNADGQVFYLLLPVLALAPDQEAIRTGSGGTASGAISVTAATSVEKAVAGLDAGEMFKLYAIFQDGLGTVSQISDPLQVTTRLSPLRTSGNQIVDEHGQAVVLNGVAVVDPLIWRQFHGGGAPMREDDFRLLAQEWRVEIVRVPIHPDLYEHNPGYLQDNVDQIVEWGDKYGMYIFIGYHAHGNALTGEVESTPWGDTFPWHGNPYNPDADLAIAALTEIVQRYKDNPWVIYGTFNEPAFISWTDWRPVAEELVDVIQALHPDALITVSGVNFASEMDGILNDPVRRDNVVYEVHPYPWVGEGWKSVLVQLNQTYPVFLGEWGFGEGQPGTADGYGEPLVDFCRQNNFGWTAWIWDNVWTPKMFNDSPEQLTPFGAVVKNALNTDGSAILSARLETARYDRGR